MSRFGHGKRPITFFTDLEPLGMTIARTGLFTVLLICLAGCGQKQPVPSLKDAIMFKGRPDEPKQQEENAQKGDNEIAVRVGDVGQYLKQPDAPRQKGMVTFVGGKLTTEKDQLWLEASYFKFYNGFRLGYVLKARLKAGKPMKQTIDAQELEEVEIRYIDDRLEAQGLTENDVATLVEQLRKPGSKVKWALSVIPDGEILEFSAPMKKLLMLGEKARPRLEKCLADQRIQNEAALILGAIGDKTTVPALIDVYPLLDVREKMNSEKENMRVDPDCLKVVCMTYALTYLTGQPIGRSRYGADGRPENHKLWQAWWAKSKQSFKVPLTKSNASWVPSYPVLTKEWASNVKEEFANGKN